MAGGYKIRSIGKALAAASIVATGALGLTGCGTNGDPGAAFFVNGQEYSERDLSIAVTQWAELSGVEVPRDQMAGYLVETDLRLQAAEEVGIALSDEDVQQTLEGLVAEMGGTVSASEISRPVRDMFRDLLLINTVRSGSVSNEDIAALDQFIAESSVVVNPRYGTFIEGQLLPPTPLPGVVSNQPTASAPSE